MNNHNSTVPAVTRLIEAFHRLPGVGPKTAQRYTYHLIKMPEEIAKEFSEAVLGIKEKLLFVIYAQIFHRKKFVCCVVIAIEITQKFVLLKNL